VATLVAVLALGGVPKAWADDRAALQAKGEQLAKDGKYTDAIEAFKAADRIEKRAAHACLISLAYTRRELWPQAELFLSFCHQRAKPGDPLPDWVSLADQQIRDRLIAAGLVEVSIEAKPPTAHVTVSSFAPDEVFEPRTIHLPIGTHVVFAKAPGYVDGQVILQISDKTTKHVVIELAPNPGSAKPGEPLVGVRPRHEPREARNAECRDEERHAAPDRWRCRDRARPRRARLDGLRAWQARRIESPADHDRE
jgi:hypothetical protein